MNKIGADNTYIPPTNERGKTNYADADVVAVFEALRTTIQIQVKFHSEYTDEWAVEQIGRYKNQIEDKETDLSHVNEEDNYIIPWVVSTCDDFTKEAIETAKKYKVRLINGIEFARLLMDTGLSNLDII